MNLIPDDDDDRGQVGIGTLIVFIAMVLVAAIAAGVLINTAGFLQDQAQNTGEESTAQVANNLQVQNAIGEVNNGAENISEVSVNVQPAPGADAIDLEELTIQYVAGDSENFVHYESGSNNATTFTTEAISAEVTNDSVMGSGDLYKITIPLSGSERLGNESDALDNLSPGEEAQLTITTPSGSQASATLTAPDSLVTAEDGDTVQM